ncbi:MAG: FmdB family transcriptional regulator [Planctomycetota bacterium]
MPIYVYEVILEDGSAGETIEVVQRMSDPPLSHHPETGQPVRKVITAASIAGRWSDMKTRSKLSDKKLGEKGFTKYEKTGDGKYEKRVGDGPDVISRD